MKDDLNARILSLYQQGHSFYKIADAVGTSPGAVSHRVRTMADQGLLALRGRSRPKGATVVKVIPPTPSISGEVGTPMSAAAMAVRDLKVGECRWPIGDPFGTSFRFCCARIVNKRFGRVVDYNRYCEEHTNGAYNLAGTRRR